MESMLRKQLKSWQRDFREKHGRDPSRKDIARVPDVASVYSQWHELQQASTSKTSYSSHRYVEGSNRQRPKETRQDTRLSKGEAKSMPPPPVTPSKERIQREALFKTPTKANSNYKGRSKEEEEEEEEETVHGSGGSIVGVPQSPSSLSPSLSRRSQDRSPLLNGRGWSRNETFDKAAYDDASSPSRLRHLLLHANSSLPSSSSSPQTPSKRRREMMNMDQAMKEMVPNLTPRTKARKRLRGEPVPPTPGKKKNRSRAARGSIEAKAYENVKNTKGGVSSISKYDQKSSTSARKDKAGKLAGGDVTGMTSKGNKESEETAVLSREPLRTVSEEELVEEEDDEEDGFIGPSPSNKRVKLDPSLPFVSQSYGTLAGQGQIVGSRKAGFQPLFGIMTGGTLESEDEEDEDMKEDGAVEDDEDESASVAASALSLKHDGNEVSSPPTELTVRERTTDSMDLDLEGDLRGKEEERMASTVTLEADDDGGEEICVSQYQRSGASSKRRGRGFTQFTNDFNAEEEGWDGGNDEAITEKRREKKDRVNPHSSPQGPSTLELTGLSIHSPQTKRAREYERMTAQKHLELLLEDDKEEYKMEEEGEALQQNGDYKYSGHAKTWGAAKMRGNALQNKKAGGQKPKKANHQADGDGKEEMIQSKPKEKTILRTARAGVGDAEDEEGWTKRGDHKEDDDGDEDESRRHHLLGEDDDWASEVDSDEYGLGDGYMDEVDVV